MICDLEITTKEIDFCHRNAAPRYGWNNRGKETKAL
jgi:hypothetical protein